jgi:hypothetical protein
MFEALAEKFGTTVKAYTPVTEVDESEENPTLLAREAGNSILAENGDAAEYVVETAEGFIVSGDRHAIFMGHNGSFQLADLPADEDEDTTEDDDDEIDIDELFADLDDDDDDDATIEDLANNLEASMAEAELTTEAVEALKEFDAAKAEDSMEKALAAMDRFDEATGMSTSRGRFIPSQGVPPMPKKPLDQGPGPGKNTGTASGSGSTKVPAGKPPKGSTPNEVGPGAKPAQRQGTSVNEDEDDERVEFLIESEQIKEFVTVAQKAGAPADASVELQDDGKYKVLLPQDVAKAVNATWA